MCGNAQRNLEKRKKMENNILLQWNIVTDFEITFSICGGEHSLKFSDVVCRESYILQFVKYA